MARRFLSRRLRQRADLLPLGLALERTTPTRVAISVTVNPVAASLVGATMLGEPLSWNLVVGIVTVVHRHLDRDDAAARDHRRSGSVLPEPRLTSVAAGRRAGCDKFDATGESASDFRNVSSPGIKNIPLHVGQITDLILRIPAHTRGRFAIVTMRWAGDAMDALASGVFFAPDENAEAYGQVVWSRSRDAGFKLASDFRE